MSNCVKVFENIVDKLDTFVYYAQLFQIANSCAEDAVFDA